jgi:hypothetical protein
MKKLFVLALSAIMIFAFAAVSMAATVTVGGELNIGMDMKSATTGSESTMNAFNETKLFATAVLDDQITAYGAFKASNHLNGTGYAVVNKEAWVSFKEGFGIVKVGHFDWNPKEYLDIINIIPDMNSPAGINLVTNVTKNVTVNLYGSETADKEDTLGTDQGALYGLKVNYATGNFGVGFVTAKYAYAEDADSLMEVNANYKMNDSLNFFLNYAPERNTTATTKAEAAIVGCTYDSNSIYARVEYNAQVEDGLDNDYGFRVGYKISKDAKIEYQTIKNQIKGSDAVSYLKVNVKF